jgi:hypothetical protein
MKKKHKNTDENGCVCQLFVILWQNNFWTMKHLLYLVAALLVLMSACGEKKSPLDAEARDSGMRAAAALVAVDHTDTMSMERAVMDAKAKQSVYALKRDSAAVRAFDEAFRSYLKEKDRPLYNSIFPDEKK